MERNATNAKLWVGGILSILIFPFIADFISYNYYQASFSLIRCVGYFLVIFVFALALVFAGKKIIGKKYELALAFSVGFFTLLLFNNYIIDGALRDLMGERFRVGFVLLADVATLAVLFIIGYFISKSKTFSFAFLATIFCTTLFNLFSIKNDSLQEEAFKVQEYPSFALTPAFSLKGAPNVYYIVPDRFTGTEMFNQLSPIKLTLDKDLERRGFRVIHDAYANGSTTLLSLSQVYSMNYLLSDNQMVKGKKIAELSTLYQQENPVTREFRRRGYKLYRFADRMIGHCVGTEDKCIQKKSYLTMQDMIFFNRTLILSALGDKLWSKSFIPGKMEISDFIPFLPSADEGPFFLIGHFSLPHKPFRFDKECNPLAYNSIFSSNQAYLDARPGKERFSLHQEQSLCAQKLLIKFIDGIKEKDPNAIIIVQADHGSQDYFDPETIVYEKMRQDNLKESFNIIYAFHGPETLTSQLFDGFSPVNTFRLVFAWLDNQAPVLLKHRSFYGDVNKQVLEKNKARFIVREWKGAPVPHKAAG